MSNRIGERRGGATGTVVRPSVSRDIGRQKPMIFNLSSAQDYAKQRRTQEWVIEYLSNNPRPNIPLRDLIEQHRPVWLGPIEVELTQLRRSCGPEAGMRWYEPPEIWIYRIDKIAHNLKHSSELPPLIVRQVDDTLSVHDGNHRLGAMLKMGWKTGWVLLWGDRDPNLSNKW